MNRQTNKTRQLLISVLVAMILIGGTFTSAYAQTTAGSYWSPAARALRREIINRAIIRQATRGRSRARYRSTKRSRRSRR